MPHASLHITTCISAAVQVQCCVETKNFFLCGLKAAVLYQMWVWLFLVCLQGIKLVRVPQRTLSFELRYFLNLQTTATVSIRSIEQKNHISVGNVVMWNNKYLVCFNQCWGEQKNISNRKIWLLNWHFASTDLPKKYWCCLQTQRQKEQVTYLLSLSMWKPEVRHLLY